jgi:hypothetical protein
MCQGQGVIRRDASFQGTSKRGIGRGRAGEQEGRHETFKANRRSHSGFSNYLGAPR